MKYPKRQSLKRQTHFAKIIPLESREVTTSDSAAMTKSQWYYYPFPNVQNEAEDFHETKIIPLVTSPIIHSRGKKREAKIIDFRRVLNQ